MPVKNPFDIKTDSTRSEMLERPLPHSAESERAILGGVILDNRLMREAHALLKPEDFYIRANQFVFRAMLSLFKRDVEINYILLGEELRREGVFEQVGATSYLTDLTHGLPAVANVSAYAKVVLSKSLLRQLVKVCNKITSEALEEEDDPQTILFNAAQLIVALLRVYQAERGLGRKTFRQVAQKVRGKFTLWQRGKTEALRTGIHELDARLKFNGLAKGDLIYIGAPPSRGKTALALQIAVLVAKRGHRVLIISLEMKDTSLFMRVLSGESWVENWKIRPDMFEFPDTVEKVASAFPQTEELAIDVDDETTTLEALQVVCTDAVRNDNVELIIVDYLQLIKGDKKLNREREVAEISTTCKHLAKALDVPFIITSQMNRSATKDDRRPELDAMRDSGQIEQDADLVIFPYGAKIGEEDDDGVRKMKLYVPKQREGRAGFEIEIDFDTEHQRFYTEKMYLEDYNAREQRERREDRPLLTARDITAENVVERDELDDIDFNF